MLHSLLYVGQWQGFFNYGETYGPVVAGQSVEFRLFVEEYGAGQFKGRIIDWEGVGADGEMATVSGFVHGYHINFVKKYGRFYWIDEDGNSFEEPGMPGHEVHYEGYYHEDIGQFVGHWEIIHQEMHTPWYTLEDVTSGTWVMHRTE